jgi:tetratricopeptide (TPR) repeat protein
MTKEAIALCPDNPGAYVNLGWVYHHDYYLRNTKSPRETLEKGAELARKALAMDDSIISAHILLCHIYDRLREHDKAVAEGARAVALDPAGISALNAYAISLGNVGRYEEAILLFQKAIRISPFGEYFLYRDFGFALRNMGRLEEAVSEFKKAMQLVPDDMVVHLGLAITYSRMSRDKEARSEAVEVLRINPKFSVDDWVKNSIFKDSSERDKLAKDMRRAGLK